MKLIADLIALPFKLIWGLVSLIFNITGCLLGVVLTAYPTITEDRGFREFGLHRTLENKRFVVIVG